MSNKELGILTRASFEQSKPPIKTREAYAVAQAVINKQNEKFETIRVQAFQGQIRGYDAMVKRHCIQIDRNLQTSLQYNDRNSRLDNVKQVAKDIIQVIVEHSNKQKYFIVMLKKQDRMRAEALQSTERIDVKELEALLRVIEAFSVPSGSGVHQTINSELKAEVVKARNSGRLTARLLASIRYWGEFVEASSKGPAVIFQQVQKMSKQELQAMGLTREQFQNKVLESFKAEDKKILKHTALGMFGDDQLGLMAEAVESVISVETESVAKNNFQDVKAIDEGFNYHADMAFLQCTYDYSRLLQLEKEKEIEAAEKAEAEKDRLEEESLDKEYRERQWLSDYYLEQDMLNVAIDRAWMKHREIWAQSMRVQDVHSDVDRVLFNIGEKLSDLGIDLAIVAQATSQDSEPFLSFLDVHRRLVSALNYFSRQESKVKRSKQYSLNNIQRSERRLI